MCAQQTQDQLDVSLRTSAGDLGLAAAKGLISAVPGVGGLAAELLGLVIVAPLSKRRDALLTEIYAGLQQLEAQVHGFKIETLADNEVFVSTTLDVVAIGVRTHQKAKLEAARSIVLNAALPNAPVDNLQKMFVTWLDQLTEWHLAVLRLAKARRLPEIDFSSSDWELFTTALDELSDVIEAEYPEFKGRHAESIQLLRDLYTWGLVTNRIPSKGMMTSIVNDPVPTPLAQQFLKFIESPLEVDTGSS